MSYKEFKAGNLTVKIYNTRQEVGEIAAKEASEEIKKVIMQTGKCNIIFAAAPSQNEFLEVLANDKTIDFSKINAFHMDEYIGIPSDAPQGFGNFLKEKIFSKVSFKTVNYINGNAIDVDEECDRYKMLLQNNPIDVVCMGIGENAHIAFNDPHVAKFNDEKMVKVVDLDEKCRIQQVNDGCFKHIDEVPTHAITLTIPTLISVNRIFCMVPSQTKANAVFNTVNSEISEKYPATILKKHNFAIMYLDKDSAQKII